MLDSTWNRRSRSLAWAAVAALALALLPRPAAAVDEEGCYGCHGLAGFAVRAGDRVRSLAIAPARFEASLHGPLACRECHAEVTAIPHPETGREVGCGRACHGGGGGKDYSHEALYWQYVASAHGSARTRKIGCLVCHPAPEPREEEGRDKLEEARRCASCHRGNPRVRAWFSDAHYLALLRGNERAPACPDCHTAHNVRRAAVAESSVNPRRLGETCGGGALAPSGARGCHGALSPAALAGASMSPLPLGGTGRRPLTLLFTVLYGALLLGLLVRAGVGIARGR